MYKTVIEVQAFGDFDIKYTDCIMVSEEKKDVKEIIKDFCVFMNIPDIKGLPSNKLYDMTQEFIEYLKMIGFTKLKTTEVYMCD